MPYTAPWGCQAYFQSFRADNNNAQTHRQSASGCSPMFARLRTSTGGASSWATGTWLAHRQISLAFSYVGGGHKICDGCTVFST